MVQRYALVLTGKSGVGKSTLARTFSEREHMPLFSLGGFERDYARSLGYNDIVRFERELGLNNAYYNLIPPMLRRISELGQHGIVIEGVYDPNLYKQIQMLFEHRTVLAEITATKKLRIKRKAEKDNLTLRDAKSHIEQLDVHKELVGSAELSRRIDLKIANTKDIEQGYNQLKTELMRLLR